MFNLDHEIFNSNRAMFCGCARGMAICFAMLCFSIVLNLVICYVNDTWEILLQRSTVSMYATGLLTTGSLWWAMSWSAARSDDSDTADDC